MLFRWLNKPRFDESWLTSGRLSSLEICFFRGFINNYALRIDPDVSNFASKVG